MKTQLRRMTLCLLCLLSLLFTACGSDYLEAEHTPSATAGQTVSPAPTKAPDATATPTPSPTETPTPTPQKVTLVAVGDNLIDWYMLDDAMQEDGSFSFAGYYDHIMPYLEMADLAVVNQETPIGGDEGYRGSSVEVEYMGTDRRWGSYHGYSTFNSPDELGEELVKAGFNVITSASNHTSDYGLLGLQNTLKFWQRHPEVTALGIYDSKESYDTIPVVEKNGIRIALLNYTYGLNISSAIKEDPYCLRILSKDLVRSDVAAAKELADFVVVFPHWGTEYSMSVSSEQKEYTDLFLELGVDVVIGAHPHIVEPMEWLTREDGHRMAVYYSLGNFISMFKSANCELEAMAYVEFVKDEAGARVEEATVIPLVNHFSYDAALGKRVDFTVYALKDYTEALANAHGCLHYSDGKTFSFTRMQELAIEMWGEHIKTEFGE